MPKQEFVYQRNKVFRNKFLVFLSFFVLCAFLTAFVVAQVEHPDKVGEVVTNLVKKVSPVVVIVYTYDSQGNAVGQGTGFFVSIDGTIITNYHVLKGTASAQIKTAADKTFPVKGIIAEDKENDLVKISIDAKEITFPTVTLAKEDVEVGQRVVVIGGPLGLEGTVSDGIVSAVRDIPAFGKIIQMTAPISPGSSGSPVFNMRGEVVGIATLMLKEGQNLNFAIPVGKIEAIKPGKEVPFSEWATGNLEAWLKSAEGLYFRGLNALLSENYITALIYFQESVKQNSKNADAHFYIGFCYSGLGRYQEEIEAYKQAIRIKPDFAEAHFYMGVAYGILGRYQEEIDAYKQAIRINPDYAEAHYNMGVVYGKLGRYQDAIEAYKQAIRIKPDFADAHYNMGVTYGKLGRYQEAIEAFKQAIRIKPNDAEAHYNMGVTYGKLGRYQEAIEAFKQAIQIKPDLAEAHYNMGVLYGKLGRYQEAIETYKQAVRIKPDYAEAHCNMGVAYGQLGRYQEEIEAYKQAIRIKPDFANAHFNMGLAYLFLGDRGRALDEYKILKDLDRDLANKLFNFIYE